MRETECPMRPSTVETNLGYGVTTAQILYRMPDHLELLQEYIWQRYDTFPDFPVLGRFLDFWQKELDGPIHSVTVAHARLITPAEIYEMRRPH